MSFRLNIKYYLVHNLGFTNKEAIRAIENRKLKVNGLIVSENSEFDETCEIYFEDKLLKPNACLFFELHESYAEQTKELILDVGFDEVEIKLDLQGKSRMLKAKKK